MKTGSASGPALKGKFGPDIDTRNPLKMNVPGTNYEKVFKPPPMKNAGFTFVHMCVCVCVCAVNSSVEFIWAEKSNPCSAKIRPRRGKMHRFG